MKSGGPVIKEGMFRLLLHIHTCKRVTERLHFPVFVSFSEM